MSKEISHVTIEYRLDEQRILENTPKTLASQTFYNEGSLEQEQSFSVSETTEKSSCFTHMAGVEVTAGVTFKTGFPVVGSAEWELSVTGKYEHTWGETTTESKTWEAQFPLKVGPRMLKRAVATVRQSRADIPYDMVIHYKDGTTAKSNGIYHGVDQIDLRYHIYKELAYQVTDSDGRKHRTGLNMEFFCPRDKKAVIVQKDFNANYGVGNFDASSIRMGNRCPSCHTQLKVSDFRKFWFNQCTVHYKGVTANDEKKKEGSANFTETPGEFADLDQEWYKLDFNLEYYSGAR